MTSAESEPWRACYRELASKLLLYARQWVACRADAEDVVQTAFVRFWRKHPAAQPEHYPLLYVAVRTAAIDHLRRNRRRDDREHDERAVPPGSRELCFDVPLEEREDAEFIHAALQRLPEDQRQTLVLRIWGGLTFQQIADAFGESINTVSSRYRYGIEALRRILTPLAHERV